MNNITITGRLTADPELKTTQGGIPVCAYTLAVKRPKVKDTTDFLTVVSWRQGAEYLTKYGHKGDMVAVSGMLTTRSWEDKTGNKRIAHEVVSDTVELVSSVKNEQNSPNVVALPTTHSPAQQRVDDVIMITDNDDLPF